MKVPICSLLPPSVINPAGSLSALIKERDDASAACACENDIIFQRSSVFYTNDKTKTDHSREKKCFHWGTETEH